MNLKHVAAVLATSAGLITSSGLITSAIAVDLDPALPLYKAVSGISGQLKSIGSDTLNNEMTLWAEGFKAQYPNVKIEIEGKGSSTAPPALVEGTSQFGPMSRPMKDKEIEAFEKKYGYKPSKFRVAVDALAGDVIFRQGDEAEELFVIQSGSVEIRLGNRALDTLPERSIFGEMALALARLSSAKWP